MKKALFFLLFFIPFFAYGQFYPDSWKLRLNYSTTSKGAIHYGNTAPSYIPDREAYDCWAYQDTTNQVFYIYNFQEAAWDTVFSSLVVHDPVTLSGVPNYITITDQDIYRDSINLATDVKGILDEANIDSDIARDSEISGTQNYLTKYGATGLTESLIFDDGTDVGIGTASPYAELDVNGRLRGLNGAWTKPTTGKGIELFFASDSDEGILMAVDRTANDTLHPLRTIGEDIRFYVGDHVENDAEVMRITNGGDVGIGTTSPSSKFHVLGDVTIQPINGTQEYKFSDILNGGGLILEGQNTGANSGFLLFPKDQDGTDNVTFQVAGMGSPSTWDLHRERISLGWSAPDSSYHIFTDSQGDGSPRNLHIYTEFDTSQLVIATDGNVGIGILVPAEKLDIDGDIKVNDVVISPSGGSTNYILSQDAIGDFVPQSAATLGLAESSDISGTQNYLTKYGATGLTESIIFDSDSLGIGTSSPGYLIDIHGVGSAIRLKGTGASGTKLIIDRYNTAKQGILDFRTNGVAKWAFGMHTDATDKLYIGTPNFAERYMTFYDGNVGIGMDTPTDKLYVDGNVYVTDSLNAEDAIIRDELKVKNTIIDPSGGSPYDILSQDALGNFVPQSAATLGLVETSALAIPSGEIPYGTGTSITSSSDFGWDGNSLDILDGDINLWKEAGVSNVKSSVFSNTNSHSPSFVAYKYGGTIASPLDIPDNSYIGKYQYFGRYGGGNVQLAQTRVQSNDLGTHMSADIIYALWDGAALTTRFEFQGTGGVKFYDYGDGNFYPASVGAFESLAGFKTTGELYDIRQSDVFDWLESHTGETVDDIYSIDATGDPVFQSAATLNLAETDDAVTITHDGIATTINDDGLTSQAYTFDNSATVVAPAAFTSGGLLIRSTGDNVAALLPHSYGEMYIDDSDPDTISITSGTPAEGTDYTAGLLSGFTYSAGRLTYTGTATIKVLVNTSISFTFDSNNTIAEAWIYQNGTEVSKSELHRKIGTGGDVGNAGQTCLLELATNDYIEVFFDASNSGDIIIYNANINITKL